MKTFRKAVALALVAAVLAFQPEAARAAGEVVSRPATEAGAAVVPRVPAASIPSLSMSAPAGPSTALPALPGTGLSVQTIGASLPAAAASAAAAAAAAAPASAPAAHAAPALASALGAPRISASGGKVVRAPTRGSLPASAAREALAAGPRDQKRPAPPSAQPPADAGRAAFDGDLRVFLTAHGREPVEASLSELPALLARDPAYAKALNARGVVRLAIAKKGGSLGAQALPEVEAALRARGVSAPVTLETVPLRSRPPRARPADPAGPSAPGASKAGTLAQKARRAVTAPVRELAYVGRAFSASVTAPTRDEIVGGVVSKGPAFALSTLWWMKVFLPARLAAFAATTVGRHALSLLHMAAPAATAASFPAHFALAVGGSLVLEAFHGVWINTWQNFQKILERQRGVNYQAAFNFLYMQASAAAFRVLTWSAIAGTIAPWSLQYWRDMGVSSVLGTFFGVLGFAGLNTLYDKGRISRRSRSWLQQGRDLFFLLAGTFLFSGSMHVFWGLWAVQQALDVSLYVISRRAAARPALYVAEPSVAGSDGFTSMYPVTPGPRPSPLRQAAGAVLGNPFVKPLLALGRWAWKKARGAAGR